VLLVFVQDVMQVGFVPGGGAVKEFGAVGL
jgi:hypothetical protein